MLARAALERLAPETQEEAARAGGTQRTGRCARGADPLERRTDDGGGRGASRDRGQDHRRLRLRRRQVAATSPPGAVGGEADRARSGGARIGVGGKAAQASSAGWPAGGACGALARIVDLSGRAAGPAPMPRPLSRSSNTSTRIAFPSWSGWCSETRAPRAVVVTTPNAEYNALFPEPGRRHTAPSRSPIRMDTRRISSVGRRDRIDLRLSFRVHRHRRDRMRHAARRRRWRCSPDERGR